MVITTPLFFSLFQFAKFCNINIINKLLQYIIRKRIKSIINKKGTFIRVKSLHNIKTNLLEIHRHTKDEKKVAVGLPIDNMYSDDE